MTFLIFLTVIMSSSYSFAFSRTTVKSGSCARIPSSEIIAHSPWMSLNLIFDGILPPQLISLIKRRKGGCNDPIDTSVQTITAFLSNE